MVKNSKRTLKVIFITHAHPDHFLGLDVLADAFPDAEITAVAEAIKENGPTLCGRMRTILKGAYNLQVKCEIPPLTMVTIRVGIR